MNPRHIDETARRGIWAFVIIVAIIFIIAAIGYFSGNWESTPP